MHGIERFIELAMPGALPWFYGLFNLAVAALVVYRVLDWRRELTQVKAQVVGVIADIRAIQAERVDIYEKIATLVEQGSNTERLLERLIGLATTAGGERVRSAVAIMHAERLLRAAGWNVLPPAAG